jgi:hypothetical protein
MPHDTQQPLPCCCCCRWLDELIIALWHDLQAYMEWQVADNEAISMVGGCRGDQWGRLLMTWKCIPGVFRTLHRPCSSAQVVLANRC